MDAILTQIAGFWDQALGIWQSGGWAMWAIAATAMVMFGMGMHISLKLRGKGVGRVSEKRWRRWIDHPEERRGKIGRLLDFVTGGESHEETALRFERLRATEAAPFDRDLRVMKVCVSAAPLLGLLGTVTGMLTTFGALASGSGGDKTMAMVASGISEALITTETGLVIALPGLFFQYQLVRKYERYKAFLAHLETVCTQVLHRRGNWSRRYQALSAARRQIFRTLRENLERESPQAPVAAVADAKVSPPAGPKARIQGCSIQG